MRQTEKGREKDRERDFLNYSFKNSIAKTLGLKTFVVTTLGVYNLCAKYKVVILSDCNRSRINNISFSM